MLQNPTFANGLGMDIHIRTKKTRQWSYISSVVLRIGDETLEVRADPQKKIEETYWIGGVQDEKLKSLSRYTIAFRQINSKQREFDIVLNDNELISIKTFQKMVRIDVKKASEENFGQSLGLMGTFESGEKMGRDGITVFKDTNAFGQEWQILPEEDMLFYNLEGPQAPARCDMPSIMSVRRRLSESFISLEAAELDCARVNPQDFDSCVFDVMAISDLEVAGAY